MTAKMMSDVLAGLLILLFVNSAFATTPDDLQFRSLRMVKSDNQKDMNWGSLPGPRSRDMLMIIFVSKYDVRAISQHEEFIITPIASLCERPEIDVSRIIRGDTFVYDQYGHIDASGDDGTSYLRMRERRDTLYHIYLDVRLLGHGALDVFGKIPFDYDLSQGNTNLCVAIHGNNSRGDEFESNVLVISASKISESLVDYRGRK